MGTVLGVARRADGGLIVVRVFVGGFQHETNTFAARPAKWDAFKSGDFFPPFARGQAMLDRVRAAAVPATGFVARALERGWKIVPSCWAGASPSASVTRDAFERIRTAMQADLVAALAAGPLDGIYLDLHGAAVCEHLDNPETELLRALRALAGDGVPLVASLDLHANVDRAMLDAADYLVAYRTHPHVDMVETGRAAFDLLADCRRSGERPRAALRRLPFLLPIVSQATVHEPSASTFGLLADLVRRHGGSASFAPGFPAADVPRCGAAVWAYGAGAKRIVDGVYRHVVDRRYLWKPRLLDADAAVAEAIRQAEGAAGPVVIADVQDNPGAGADGDTTGLLHALLRAGAGRRWPGRIALGLLHDPATAALAAGLLPGAGFDVRLGASVTTWSGARSEAPVAGRAVVRKTTEGRVVLRGPMMAGMTVEAGRSASLEIDGILVGVASARTQTLDRALFRMVGIEPDAMKIVVVKSAVHFRADFCAVMAGCIPAKSAGPMAADPADLPWTRLDLGIDARV